MKWNVSALRRSGECERTEVADFELSEFFNRIASAEGKAWVLSVERVGDVGDSALVEPDGDELVTPANLGGIGIEDEHPNLVTLPSPTVLLLPLALCFALLFFVLVWHDAIILLAERTG